MARFLFCVIPALLVGAPLMAVPPLGIVAFFGVLYIGVAATEPKPERGEFR